jgi:hypothetical protein
MRMAAQELFRNGLDHAAEIERALLLGHAGMEHDLEQEVAEFLAQVVKIAAGNRVGDFVGLFQRIGRDGREILLEIPRAPCVRGTQRRHDLEKSGNVPRRFHAEPSDGLLTKSP